MPSIDELAKLVVKDYKKASVGLADDDFYLDNMVDIVLMRYDIYDNETIDKVLKLASSMLKNPNLWTPEKQKEVEKRANKNGGSWK